MKRFGARVLVAFVLVTALGDLVLAKTVDPDQFIAKLARKKYKSQLSALTKVTDEKLLAEIAKSMALPSGVSLAAMNRLTDPEMISDVALFAPAYEVQAKAVEQTKDQTILIAILMEPDRLVFRPFDAAASRLTETSAVEVATKAPIDSNRARAVSRLTDQQLLSDIAVKEAGNIVSVKAIETMTDQDLLAALAIDGAKQSMRSAAIKKVTNQVLLATIARGNGSLYERKTALSQITSEDTLAEIALAETMDKTLREEAVRHIEDPNVLVQIAKGESNLDMLMTALRRIPDTSSLLEIAGTARYRLTRELLRARIDSHWRRELGLVSVKFNIGTYQTELTVTVTNHGQDKAYTTLRYKLGFMGQIDADRAPELSGTVEPGETETLTAWLSGDWRSTLHDQSVLILLNANPILPGGAVDLTALGEVPTDLGANHAPTIAEQALWKHTTITDQFFGDLKRMTTEVIIHATDPNGDILTYEWSASNGTLDVNRPIASWERVVVDGKAKSGTISVTVDDGRGGRVSRTFSTGVN
ncbi:MAG: hypothetical protein K8R59_03745 [Thermoanaerobaculales bacterium]|nr:hypothetical protein [Thermoanaerobaculales bacterium]